jgi:hypothetical protein
MAKAEARGGQGPKKRRRSKAEPAEPSPEELEQQAKTRRLLKRRGIWEVSLKDGAVLGLFEGTPQKVGAYVVAQQSKSVRGLFFQSVKIRSVPEDIVRERCCDRKFQRSDNFCAICGLARAVQPKIPAGIDVTIDTD